MLELKPDILHDNLPDSANISSELTKAPDMQAESSAENPEGNPAENINIEKYLIFSVMDKMYCFPSNYIAEIAVLESVYPLPLMPPYVLGIINRYSVPYALFDISLLFYKTPGNSRKVLVVKDDIDRIAFLIDEVTGIVDIQQDNLFFIEKGSEANDLTEAVCATFTMNSEDVFVLDIYKILERVKKEVS